MIYDLYYHNDFDGRAAAAIMLDFLRSQGDDVEHFTPLDYYLMDKYLKEDFFTTHKLFKGKHNPAIVVDFPFHPGAAWWFDHHDTSLRKGPWEKRFKATRQWHFDPDYDSCCGQVAVILKKEFGWKPKSHFKELIKWGDIMDGAKYKSAKQATDLKEPAIQVAVFFDRCGNIPAANKKFVNLLAEKSIRAIARQPEVQKVTRVAKHETALATAYVKKNLSIVGRIGEIYFSRWQFAKPRYIPYVLHPELTHLVRFFKKKGFYHLSVGQNPWRKKENKVNLGELISKYGNGGGHFGVGGAEVKTKAEAERAMKEMVEYLIRHS